jgi:hypothetical protein
MEPMSGTPDVIDFLNASEEAVERAIEALLDGPLEWHAGPAEVAKLVAALAAALAAGAAGELLVPRDDDPPSFAGVRIREVPGATGSMFVARPSAPATGSPIPTLRRLPVSPDPAARATWEAEAAAHSRPDALTVWLATAADVLALLRAGVTVYHPSLGTYETVSTERDKPIRMGIVGVLNSAAIIVAPVASSTWITVPLALHRELDHGRRLLSLT